MGISTKGCSSGKVDEHPCDASVDLFAARNLLMLILSRHFTSLLIIFYRSTSSPTSGGHQSAKQPTLLFFISLIYILESLLPAASADHFNPLSRYGGDGRPLNPYACGSPRTCYSCASMRFKRHWSSYSAFFQKPLNFTEHCDPPLFRLKAPTDTCVAPCLTLIEPHFSLLEEWLGKIKFTATITNKFYENPVSCFTKST
uniref:Uncharacterized protein n=1 Tax=Romanomermis culicivorax TaxID=13658 RepID=A0A915J1C2_ROMCU